MEMRWRYLLTLLLLSVAFASDDAEDNIPDAGVDDNDEISLREEETRNLRPRAYTPAAFNNQLPSGFRPTPSLAELAGYQQRPQQEQEEYIVQPRPTPQLYIEEPRPQIQRAPQRKQEQRPARLQQRPVQEVEEELEEEEKEEPDRLSALLQESKFNCVNKQTGYYADEELNCEVFHYCQDNVKHSWICPDGFTFHQVHLICMPPTHDNICQKSSKYHFVNEYLYRPINQEEVQRKPNVSLKYSDRYYPAEVYRDDRYEQEEGEEEEEAPRRQPAPAQLQARPSPRPQGPQVFRSAEEVNIPLVQRRPQRPYDFDF